MPTPTEFAALIAEFQDLINKRDNSDDKWFDWQVGVVGGGPEGDGRYPLMNRSGEEVLVLCPAAMAAQFLGVSYQVQFGFDEALGAAETLPALLMPAAIRFQDNFTGAIGKLLGTAPASNMVIDIRHYLANLTGGSVVGTITITPSKVITFATAGTGNFDVAAGDLLVPQGPLVALGATRLSVILKGEYL